MALLAVEPAGTPRRGADLRPLGWDWTASLAVTAAAALLFSDVSGRSAVFGSVAWAAICVAPALGVGELDEPVWRKVLSAWS